ncbi:MAG: MOSC domain-containing protein [Nocardioidaceae bacterium]
MREVSLGDSIVASETATLRACIATILEAPLEVVPEPVIEQGGVGFRTVRWLSGRGLGLVPVADAASFAWAGPWIGWVRSTTGRRAVVMYGVPSGIAWDPAGIGELGDGQPEAGFVIAAGDVALALPPAAQAPTTTGAVDGIYLAEAAGEPAQAVDSARALPDLGLEGDRHVTGEGTFPSGLPGSALTLIQSEVCNSFTPQLGPDEHRRNIVTSGIDLDALVGHEFVIGGVRCRGMRLCEPCTVQQGYASRPVLRELVHRGGLRADIVTEGVLRVGDKIRAV